MSKSKRLKEIVSELTPADTDRLIRMGWDDHITFEAIEFQFGIPPNSFVKLMRSVMDSKTYARWRKRVSSRGHLKHQKNKVGEARRAKGSSLVIDEPDVEPASMVNLVKVD